VFTPPDKEILVEADSIRIAEVVNNLISNAIKYTDKGGITVETHEDKTKNLVYTSIRDTSRGIPKESLPHMFEKFFRVKAKLEQEAKGTGLGLYISKSIVELTRWNY